MNIIPTNNVSGYVILTSFHDSDIRCYRWYPCKHSADCKANVMNRYRPGYAEVVSVKAALQAKLVEMDVVTYCQDRYALSRTR